MAKIVSVGTCNPEYHVNPETTSAFIEGLFSMHHQDIGRLLQVVQNGEIKKRYVSAPVAWFEQKHTLEEKNNLYIQVATDLGIEAIDRCLQNEQLQQVIGREVRSDEIDAIIFISSTGISTPTIDAKIMNRRPFSPHTKRIPLWGLGCAGGVSGIARASEYCMAYPKANVLVVCVELCSLTFQREDYSKSNLIGTSLFADGVACALVVGDQSTILNPSNPSNPSNPTEFTANYKRPVPQIIDTLSTFMPDSEDVMGWELKDSGFHVIFSKDIPSVIRKWLKPNVQEFLEKNRVKENQITHFIAHPGGKKVLQAYRDSLNLEDSKTDVSKRVLQNYGNMSSPTVLFVLKEFMESIASQNGDIGLMLALGPGFSSELALVRWTTNL